jgi:glycosyltransferase involved in cell wall biosynthesis
MIPKLVIVQDRPTQFDVPFYDYVRRRGEIDLLVYYSRAFSMKVAVDGETGYIPDWDHIHGCSYNKKHLDAGSSSHPVRLADEISGHHPDLVIISGYYPPLHTMLAILLKRRGIRVGLRSDNTIHHSVFKGVKGAIKRLVLPRLLGLYDSWHPVGSLAKKYLSIISKTERPVFFFPYNVHNDWFLSESSGYQRQSGPIRATLGFTKEDFVVLGILKWVDREDPLTLISAFTMLRDWQPNARLILIGDGPLRSAVHEMAGKLGKSVFLPGYVPYSELPKYYAISDVYVHPAPGEPWGVSVNEAMACGLPVIAAEGVGAGADLIVGGETGFVFPDRDSRKLSELLIMLSRNRELRLSMSSATREKIAGWSYEQAHCQFLKALGG